MSGDSLGLDREEVAARHAEHEPFDDIVGLGLEQVPDRVDPLGELLSELGAHVPSLEDALHPGHELAQQCLAPRGPCRGARRDRVGLRQQGEGGKAVG